MASWTWWSDRTGTADLLARWTGTLPRRGPPPLADGAPAVHRDGGAGHERGVVAGQEGDRRRDLLGRPQPPHRHPALDRGARRRRVGSTADERVHDRRVHRAGADAV